MRRVLVLGGTGWLGQAVAKAALDDGAEVVCLARGLAGGVPDGVTLIAADRLDPRTYEQLQGEWDDVIELSYEPNLVTPAVEALAARAAHWTLISSVSVYADNSTPFADESAELVTPQDLTEYPDAKVAAESTTASRLGDRLLIARPGLIVGPGDPTDRFGYWPARLQQGGQVLHPETRGRYVQVIDVNDLASWVARAGRQGTVGPVNAVGAVHTMQEFLDVTAATTGFTGELISASDQHLIAAGIRYWAGPSSLPLWLPTADAAFAQRNGSAFLKTGGTLRPLASTLQGVLADEIERGLHRVRRSGLTFEEECTALHAL